jgi:hypothetical protein
MFSSSSHQCDICFQPYSPFFIMRILPVTPIIALSGTATPIHVRTPGATISVCRYCLQAYSNLEPCIDPANTPSSPALPDASEALETTDSPASGYRRGRAPPFGGQGAAAHRHQAKHGDPPEETERGTCSTDAQVIKS